jgi:hypothetical protein
MSLPSLRISRGVALAALFALLVCGAAYARRSEPTPTPSPTPTPIADPAVTKVVRQQFLAWQTGTLNKTAYNPNIRAKLTDAIINDVSHKLASLGALTDTIYIGPFFANDLPPDAHGYIYQMICREGNVYLFTVLDNQGKIATIYFKDKLTTETVEVPATGAPSPEPSP